MNRSKLSLLLCSSMLFVACGGPLEETPGDEVVPGDEEGQSQDALASRHYALVAPDFTIPGSYTSMTLGQSWDGVESFSTVGLTRSWFSSFSVVSQSYGTLDAFYTSYEPPYDGQSDLWVRWLSLRSGSWTQSWLSAPAVGVSGTPDSATWGSGHLHVIVRGFDNQIYVRRLLGGSWSAWTSIGAPAPGAVGEPTIVATEPNKAYAFVSGGDNAIWYNLYFNGSWSGWIWLGGGVVAHEGSGPDAVSQYPGHVAVFVPKSDYKEVLYRESIRGIWGPWKSAGAPNTFSGPRPTAASPARGEMNLFVTQCCLNGSKSDIYRRTFKNGAWDSWTRIYNGVGNSSDAASTTKSWVRPASTGTFWNFDTSNNYNPSYSNNGDDMITVARYVASGGPCAGKGAGACVFDTRTFLQAPWASNHRVESITAYGRYWNYDLDAGNALVGSGDLTSVARYTASGGPCAGRAVGTCTFDTRAIMVAPWLSNHRVESVTAYGRYWSWDIDNNYVTVGSGDLTSVARYTASGAPCAGRAAGTCKFDTRAQLVASWLSNHRVETITAYGRYWNFDVDNNYVLHSTGDLTSVARYASGPCAGRAAGTCTFRTRTFITSTDGHVHESINN